MDSYTIDVDGIIKEVKPANGKSFTLIELYRHTGSDIVQIVRTLDGRFLICDEEGKLKGKPKNVRASLLYSKSSLGDYIVGKVLVCKPKMIR